MMEETVPLASSNRGSGKNSQVQHRSTAANATSSSSSTTIGSNYTPNDNNNNSNNNNDNGNHENRSRRHLSTYVSPMFLLNKSILFLIILMKIILYPIRKLSLYLFPLREFDGLTNIDVRNNSGDSNQLTVADKAARQFVKMFQSRIIARIDDRNAKCPFTSRGYNQTIHSISNQITNHSQAITNLSSCSDDDDAGFMYDFIPSAPPLLLIYLHSPFNPSCVKFCQDVLTSNRILKFLNDAVGLMDNDDCSNGGDDNNDNIDNDRNGRFQQQQQQQQQEKHQDLVCWGGSIHTADGKYVEKIMNVTSYPFLALVRVRPQQSNNNNDNGNNANTSSTMTKTNLEMYFRFEGPKLSTIHPNVLYTYISQSINEYNQQQSEEIAKAISRQQDINLRNEQDREYREALEEAQRREREKEEEERMKIEEEERVRIEEEKIVKEKEGRIVEARRVLGLYGDEPNRENDDENCVRIRLMLPSGKKVERKFRGKETIDTIKSFLIVYFEDNKDTVEKIENFQLSSNYPRKVLVDGEATLESEGLCPQAVIMVQDLDA